MERFTDSLNYFCSIMIPAQTCYVKDVEEEMLVFDSDEASMPLMSCPLQDLLAHHSYQRWPVQLHSQSRDSVHSCLNSMRLDYWISASGQLWLPSSSFDCCHSTGQPRAGIFCPVGCFPGSIDVDLIRWAVCSVHRLLCSEESATSCLDRTGLLWHRCCNG